jgi:hypothetical protein
LENSFFRIVILRVGEWHFIWRHLEKIVQNIVFPDPC